jgi:hypothetical protein
MGYSVKVYDSGLCDSGGVAMKALPLGTKRDTNIVQYIVRSIHCFQLSTTTHNSLTILSFLSHWATSSTL